MTINFSYSDYTEKSLVEKPAIEVFKQLGWFHQDCQNEFEEIGRSFLDRETKSDVVLISKLRTVVKKINPTISEEVLEEAIKTLTADKSLMGMVSANREVYGYLKNGILVSYLNNKNEHLSERVQIIDWNNIENNDFFLASQFQISGEMYNRRADLIGFVNGIPLLFIELKSSQQNIKKAFDDNLRDYKSSIPQLFWYNGLIILSNGSQSRVGTISSDWEHFSEWKKINDEGEKGIVSLDTVIKGVCEKSRFLDIIENYILFKEEKNGPIKIIAKNHQYLGVENVIKAFRQINENKGKLGVFWHTQGSGKTESMIFLSQKILRKIPGNWTFVVVTDRNELDEQTYKRFARAGVIYGKQEWAETSDGLRLLLKEDHRFIFTTIQKFRTEKGKRHPVISDRSDIVVIADEAHRTQYDTFAMNMRNALPNARFIAFTGTPLIVGEEKTREVFGDYVSIYNFRQAIEDNATVPLYYENRKPKIQLVNLNLNEDIQNILEEAELDQEQMKKFEREFSKEYHLITRDDRLSEIAQDIVLHFINRGFMGKAMIVSIDKATAVKMYDKVAKFWNKYIDELQNKIEKAIDDKEKGELAKLITFMKKTDMAVVVSPSQNEVEDLKEKGVDITPHRKRMNLENLDEKFKDPDDPLRIVFVCAMWMTGFDVPSCSTIYLDKPMKNHTLMQTIARANRVFGENKIAGFIVDYIGVLHNLNKALAIYATPTGGETSIDLPIFEKTKLIEELRKHLKEIQELFTDWKISLIEIMESEGLKCIKLLDNAVESILVNDERQSLFKEKNSMIQRIYKTILPDTSASEFQPFVKILQVLSDKLSSISPTTDISDVIRQVTEVLDRSVKVEKTTLSEKNEPYKNGKILDLSKLDLKKLQDEFNKGHKRVLVERLRKAIGVKLEALCMLNKFRYNFMERFQQLIDEYNSGSMNVEEYFNKLLEFIKSLNDEEKRSLTENLSEEELAVFDLLVNPPLKMSKKDVLEVKKIAQELLEKLKTDLLVLDWRKKQQARASVKLCIEEMLEKLPSLFSTEIYHQKCGLIYQHIYESYYGSGLSIYAHQKHSNFNNYKGH